MTSAVFPGSFSVSFCVPSHFSQTSAVASSVQPNPKARCDTRFTPCVIPAGYAVCMLMIPRLLLFSPIIALAIAPAHTLSQAAQIAPAVQTAQATPASPVSWAFAVSGDSRNCGDFVMPAIAAKVKAENDVLYWHLGDFRWMSQPDQDLIGLRHP